MKSGIFHRNTPQRSVILSELRRLHTHPTAQELYEIVRKKLPRISLGTVYRNLDLLAEAGVIVKIHGQGGQARFDGRMERHCHIRCVKCGRVDDVSRPMSKPVFDEMKAIEGYKVLSYCLEYSGICPACRRSG